MYKYPPVCFVYRDRPSSTLHLTVICRPLSLHHYHTHTNTQSMLVNLAKPYKRSIWLPALQTDLGCHEAILETQRNHPKPPNHPGQVSDRSFF